MGDKVNQVQEGTPSNGEMKILGSSNDPAYVASLSESASQSQEPATSESSSETNPTTEATPEATATTPENGGKPEVIPDGVTEEGVLSFLGKNEQLKGIFGETELSMNSIVDRLTKQPEVVEKTVEAAFSEEQQKFLDLGKQLESRNDLKALVEYSKKPGANVLEYAKIMSLKTSEMSDMDAIKVMKQMEHNGSLPDDKLTNKLKYDYMELDQEYYEDRDGYDETDHRYRKDAAELKLIEDGKAARQFISDMQDKAQMPEEAKQVAEKDANRTATLNKNIEAWNKNIDQTLDPTREIKHKVQYKDDEGNTSEYDYTFGLDPKEGVALKKEADDFLSGVLQGNPNFDPTPENVELVQGYVMGRYLKDKHTSIVDDSFRKGMAAERERQAQIADNPQGARTITEGVKTNGHLSMKHVFG